MAKHISLTGLIFACILFIESLKPVLLPLTANSQIIFSAIVFALGYDIGALIEFGILKLLRSKLPFNYKNKNILIITIGLVWIIVTGITLNIQNEHYAALGINRFPPSWVILMPSSVLLAFVLLQTGNIIRVFGKFCAKRLRKPHLEYIVYSFVIMIITSIGYLALTLSIFALQVTLDNRTKQKSVQQFPVSSAFKSSGFDSLISWEGLGQKGKEFVSSKGTLAEIGINIIPPKNEIEPIRIYAGIGNEKDLDKRVDLIMSEFERTKAYERSTVTMFTPSGSGWVDPVAVESLEHITKGNVASVSLQYSDNQAIVQYIKDPKIPGKASALLFTKISQRLSKIPESQRPKLFVYGESLGSVGSQEILKNTAIDQTFDILNGALWVGSPHSGPVWKRLGFDGNPMSQSKIVHVGENATELQKNSDQWGPNRIAFLYNETDPIVWSNPNIIYSKPFWLKENRLEINRNVHWIPLLSYGHLWFELFSAKDLPSGLGHNYDLEIPCALAYVIQAGIDEMC